LGCLAYFFENPKQEMYLRELARKLNMSAATVMRITNFLVGEGMLEKRVERNATYFRANLSPDFKELKKICGAGVIDLLKSKSVGLASVLLYGSAAKGEDDAGSGYDFLVIASRCDVRASELSERLGREVSLQVYDATGWKKTSKQNRAFYLDIISNSIALYGETPVIDWH
jgi:predicted nucleotidyltransferase